MRSLLGIGGNAVVGAWRCAPCSRDSEPGAELRTRLLSRSIGTVKPAVPPAMTGMNGKPVATVAAMAAA